MAQLASFTNCVELGQLVKFTYILYVNIYHIMLFTFVYWNLHITHLLIMYYDSRVDRLIACTRMVALAERSHLGFIRRAHSPTVLTPAVLIKCRARRMPLELLCRLR